MLNPSTDPDYIGKVDSPSTDFPYGKAVDAAIENDPSATPLLAKKFNDDWGFDAALLAEAGMAPTGTPDTATSSQRLSAIKALIASNKNVTFSSEAAMVAGAPYAVGQSLAVADNNVYSTYTVVTTPADVDLGGGQWANRVDCIGTRVDDIRLFGGSVLSADNSPAFLAAKAAAGTVFFPHDGDNTYTFTTWEDGYLSGVEVHADANVLLVFPDDTYAKFDGGVIASNLSVKFANLNTGFKPKAYLDNGVKTALAPISRPRVDVNSSIPFAKLVGRQVVWGADAFTSATLTDTTGYQAAVSGLTGNMAGAFAGIRVGETITSVITNDATPSNPIGVAVRGSNGYMVIYKDPTDTNAYLTVATKLTGGAITEGVIDYPLRGSLLSFEIANSEVSITLVNPLEFIFSLNGCAVPKPRFGGIGTIYEVGFIGRGIGGSAVACTLSTPMCQFQESVIGMPQLSEVRVFGDSTADEFFGCFTQYLPQVMDSQMGVKLESITNLAVAGHSLENVLASMQTDGFGSAAYVVVAAGTNNIQAGQPLVTFANIFQTVLNEITGAGRKPVIVEPWMWYPKSANGGNGQDTNNYAGGAQARAFMQRATVDAGGVYIRTTQELPNPLPSYVSSQKDPLLRDNIHQSALAYQLYAQMIGNAILADFTKVSHSWAFTPAAWAASGVDISSGLYRANSDGTTSFNITASFPAGKANGSPILTLPRWVSVNARNVPVITINNTTFTASAAYVNVAGDGVVSAQLFKAADTIVVFEFTI